MGLFNHLLYPTIFVLSIFFHTSSTLIVTVPTCPDVKPVENFNITNYLGIWHDLARYPIQLDGLKFISYDVKNEEGNWIVEELDNPEKPNPQKMVARIHLDADNKGILTQNLTYGTPPTISVIINEYILSAVYDKYYISYVCLYDDQTKMFNEYSTVGVRSENPSEEVKTAINDYIKSSNILKAENYEWNSKLIK